MSLQPISSAAAPPTPAPVPRTDLRPTADTAALVRDPQPDIPLPVPASISQKSTVTQAKMSSAPVDVYAVQRVLKPYGVVMLPQGPAGQPADEKADAAIEAENAPTVIPPQIKAAAATDSGHTALAIGALPTDDTGWAETDTSAI